MRTPKGLRGRPRQRTIYCSISAQHDNLGDIEIRSVFVDWLLQDGGAVVIFLGSMPRGYIDAFQLPESTKQTHSRWRFQGALLVDVLRRRASIAFAPGPQSFAMTRASMGKTAVNVINATLVRISGGKVVGAGRALRGSGRIARSLERFFVRRFNIYTVRDTVSARQLGMPLEEYPDLAFAHSGEALFPKTKVLISLRSDREVNLALLSTIINTAVGAGLEVNFVTQVRRDDAQHEELSRVFGIPAVLWGERSHLEQFRRLRECYATASFVVSNRLHALILGIQHLANPVALIDPGVDKLSATIPPWVNLTLLSSCVDDAQDFTARLLTAEDDRQLLAERRDVAQEALVRLRDRIRRALGGTPESRVAASESVLPARRVVITQPYVPAYRVALWERVIDGLSAQGIESVVAHGGDHEQNRARAARGDAADPSWAVRVPVRPLQILGRGPKLIFRLLPRPWRGSGVLLVTEMQASNVNAWWSSVRRRAFITFGHGTSGTTSEGRLSTMLENRLNKRAAHVITYSERGRQHVIEATGRVASDVTSFGNATDTGALGRALTEVTPEVIAAFHLKHGIPSGVKIALYVGALSPYKNIDLLVAAAREVLQFADHWLVVAGDGEEMPTIKALASETGRVTVLGHSTVDTYAPAARASSLLVNPGRVGLIAVDALVMGLPILTTTSSEHAPEFDYLRPGEDVVEVVATPQAYSAAWKEGLRPVSPAPDIPSIEKAADAVTRAILEQLDRRKPPGGRLGSITLGRRG